MNTPPPTPPDDPLTDRAKGCAKGIGYLLVVTLVFFGLVFNGDVKSLPWLFIVYFGFIIKGFAYILKGNQKVQEEEQKKQQQEEGGCSRAFIITIVIIFILALACCLFVSLFGG